MGCQGANGCRGEPWSREQLCLIHHSDRERLLGDAYSASVPFEIDLAGVNIDGPFSELIAALSRAHPDTSVDYNFRDATFDTVAQFRSAVFTGNTTFACVNFTDDAWFETATFAGGANFASAIFNGSAQFCRASFYDTPYFGQVQFHRDSRFSGAEFRADVTFVDAVFEGRAEFFDAAFGGSVVFDQTRFETAPAIVRASFRGGILGLSGATGCPLTLSRIRLEAPMVVELGEVPLTVADSVVDQPLTVLGSAATLRGLRGCTITQPVVVSSGVKLTDTSFAGTTGLDQIRPTGDPEWRRHAGRRVVFNEAPGAERVPDIELEMIYRQLRVGLEVSRSHADANDFYWGELEARRRRAKPASSDRWLLTGYKYLLGYGVRANNPAAGWLATIAVLTLVFAIRTDELVRELPEGIGPRIEHWGDSLAFVLQNSTNLLRTVDSGLEWDGTLLLLLGRVLTVTFLAGTFFALRSRIAR